MSPVLANLSIVVGLLLGTMSLLAGLVQGVPVWTALFRAAIVLSVGTVVVMAFFRSFNSVLYRFLAEKLQEFKEQEQEGKEGKPEGAGEE